MTAVLAFALAVLAFAGPAPVPTPVGVGPAYRLPAAPAAVVRAAQVGRLACSAGEAPRERAHVELFANRRVLLLPPGIGMAPPLRLRRVAVTGARCSYPLRTTDPTGVVEFVRAAQPTLGDLFSVWGQPLGRRRLAGFRARGRDEVKAWVGGRRWRGDVRAIPLRGHAEIVVELGGFVPPHAFYRFPSLRQSTP
jgi:hypothetical protein